ncbi:MAG: phosphohydrolase, partial [Ruminococcus sp.]|nr:phosphohydrolase [Ruminococcus sp.]
PLHQLAGADMADEILLRLKSDTASRERVKALVAEHDNRIPAQVKPVKRFIAKYDYDFFNDWLEVRRADTLAQSEYLRAEKLAELEELGKIAEQLKEQDACLKLSDLAIGGRELMELGYRGPQIGEMLKEILSEVIEERLDNNAHDLKEYAAMRSWVVADE